VTSADVTASLARVARPSVASPNATMLDEISGWSALQQDEDKQHGHLTGMSAPDPRSVQVALSTADAQWPRVLATAVGVVLPASVAKHDNGFGAFSNKPTCVGPYRLSAPWRPGDGSITLLRSASYDGGSPRSTRAGRGWADRVVFRIYPTAAAVSTAYRRGEVDVAQLAPSQTDAERGLLGAAEVRTAGDSTIGYIGLPTSVPPFDDPAVRVALSMALDRDLIARRVYGGGRLPLLGVYPPTVGADIWRPHACSTAPAGGDVAAATRSLGARLTLLRGKTFPLYVDDEFANRALVAAVAAQWHRAFGVTFHIEGMPFEAYVQRAVAAPGFDGPFRLSYASASASAGDYARELLAGAAIGVSNATRFLDAKVEQLLRDDAAKQATARGFAALRAVEDEFCRQMPFVPVTVNEQVWAWRSDLGAAGGVQLDRATGLPLIREAFRKAA
jgi:oligopeptide transport system substrate-binding protein